MATTGIAYNPPREANIAFNAKDYADENNNIITTQEALERYKFVSTGAGSTAVELLNELDATHGIQFQKTATETAIGSSGVDRSRFNLNGQECITIGGDGSIDSGVCFKNSIIENLDSLTCASGFSGDLNGNASSSDSATNALDCGPIQDDIQTLTNITQFNCMDYSVADTITIPNLITQTVDQVGVQNPFSNTTKLNTTVLSNIIEGETTAPNGNYINIRGNGIDDIGIGDKTLIAAGENPQITFRDTGTNRPSFCIAKGGSGVDNENVITALRHRSVDTTSFGTFPNAIGGDTHFLEFQMISDYTTSTGSGLGELARFRWNAKGKWLSQVAGYIGVDIDYFIAEPHRDNGGGSTGLFTFPEDVYVRGYLTGGTKSFKIPHPLDDKKTLSHVAIEAPRVENIYQGLATLTNGYAEIDMDTFAKLSSGSWTAINHNACSFVSNTSSFKSVRSVVVDGLLKIYCEDDTSNDIISWIVIAERCDAEIKASDCSDENGRLITEYIPPPPIIEEE